MRIAALMMVLCAWLASPAMAATTLTGGVAVTDPQTLTSLERDHGLGLATLLQQRVSPKVASMPVRAAFSGNDSLFRIPALTPIARAVKEEIAAQRDRSLEPLVRANRAVSRF